MCLGVPGEVLEVERQGDGAPPMGRVSFGGVIKEVCLAYVPEVEPGDYVIVHVGFAISRLDREEAAETLRYLAEIDRLGEELAGGESRQ